MQLSLREGENTDMVFFKVFFTTAPADFSHIAQESPFEETTTRAGPSESGLPSIEKWGSRLATVVIQKRRPLGSTP